MLSLLKQVKLILAFNGSFTLDGRPLQGPPLKKVRLYQEKMGKDLPGKVERQGNAEMTGSTTTGMHTEDIDPNKSPPFFPVFFF